MPYADRRDPFSAPNYDVFTPARRQDARGIIEGAPLDGMQNYIPWIGLSTVRELALKYADKTGLVDAEAAQETADLAGQLLIDLTEAREHIEELEAKLDRVAGLSKDGFKVQRVMGRPKKDARAAA